MSDRLRSEPRFSINKLAEYVVTTSPRRRRALIIDQIRPRNTVTATYEDARRGLIRHFANPSSTPADLRATADRLRDKASEVRGEEQRHQSLLISARALEQFLPMAEKVRQKNLIAAAGARRDSNLNIAGVRVVVCPDLVFLERGTERRLGAMKFHFPVSNRLVTDALRYVAAILYTHLEEEGDAPLKAACIAVDVMTNEFECAPRAVKDRRKNLDAACEEISERWPALYEMLLAKREA